MNKLVKGGLAAAAGIALLMGGAGSLAVWTASGVTSSGQVHTGHLTLSTGSAGDWSKDYLVPGDTDTYTQTFTLSVLGDDIQVALSSAVGTATSPTLPSSIVATTSYVINDGTTSTNWNGTDAKTLAQGNYTVTATVTVAFDHAATGDMDGAFNLGDVTFTATQL